MHSITHTEYRIHGEDFGVTGLEPYAVMDKPEEALTIERLLHEAQANGCMAIALSDDRSLGREGARYPGSYRAKRGYPADYWAAHFGTQQEDSVFALAERCRMLMERQQDRDNVPLATAL